MPARWPFCQRTEPARQGKPGLLAVSPPKEPDLSDGEKMSFPPTKMTNGPQAVGWGLFDRGMKQGLVVV